MIVFVVFILDREGLVNKGLQRVGLQSRLKVCNHSIFMFIFTL